MRLKRARRIAITTLAVLGVAALVAAFFAFELGLDSERPMGGQRVALAYLGGFSLALAALLAASGRLSALWHALGGLKFVQGIRQSATRWTRPFEPLNRLCERFEHSRPAAWLEQRPALWAALGAGLVILISLWYLTSGTLTHWTPYTHYFDTQADAFRAGQLALLDTPPAALLNLPNPYDWQKRGEIGGFLWDVSLYNGKYYLYWGPVPALLATGVKQFGTFVVEDQFLLLFFTAGLALSLAALLFWLRQAFFPRAPAWTLLLFTLLGGLNLPQLWLVNRPNVYETSIAGGQFLLLLGLLAALRSMAGRAPAGWLVLAGLAWGAAIGCRANNALAVGWMAALACLFFIRRAQGSRGWLLPALCLLAPLAAWGAGLAWYNLARFGSIFETGHHYQLSGPALPADYSQIVSPAYILPNLYNLLARPLVFDGQNFPFVFTPFITGTMWPWFIKLSGGYYYSEPIAGLLVGLPALWLCLVPAIRMLRTAWAWLKEKPPGPPGQPVHPVYPWAWAMLGGAAACSLAILAVYISTLMRYEADLTPLLTVFSALSLWWALEQLRLRPGAARLVLLLAAALVCLSVSIGLLANFQNPEKRFPLNNPALYAALAHFFGAK